MGGRQLPFEYDRSTYKPVARKFRRYFAAALAALVVAMVRQRDDADGRYIARELRLLAEKIKLLIENLPEGMTFEERAQVFHERGRLYRFIVVRLAQDLPFCQLQTRIQIHKAIFDIPASPKVSRPARISPRPTLNSGQT
jgi:hypothetical protein